MKTPIYGITPTHWLTSIGKPSSKITEILASFKPGEPITLYRYSAPHLFLRFHGTGSPTPIFAPNYWADGSALFDALNRASQFDGFLTESEIQQVAKNYYRDITAICHNWNPLASDTFWKIELRGSETIEGIEGIIAEQPTHAGTGTMAPSSSMLRGGGLQVFINPQSPFLCTPQNWD